MSGEEADGSKPQGGGVHYGTFQGPPSYPPPRPPPSLSAHHRGDYQAVPGNLQGNLLVPFLGAASKA
uniref:Uncharacterized protein n=1 Tax=Zea mays TaxID=4577 RepID=B6SIS2_MAIZE|nr:hypothetical protein [Zea mays]